MATSNQTPRSLNENALISGGAQKPPMPEKGLYDQWKSRIEHYMLAQPHGRSVWQAVLDGPMIWPTKVVNGQIVPKSNLELTADE